MSEEYVLELEHIRKEYPGVVALKDVTLQLRKGEVLGLIGENGAGKSTLIKCCSGAVIPTSGKIKVNGKEFDRMTPQLAAENGIAIIYQEFNLVPDTPEKHIEDTMNGGDLMSNEALVRLMVYSAPRFFDILLDNGLVIRTFTTPEEIAAGVEEGRVLKADTLAELAEKINAVEIYRTRDEANRVVGIRAATKDGYKTIEAKKGVILATGGFSSNVPMRKTQVPYLDESQPTTNIKAASTGEGIYLAQAIGANTMQMSNIQRYPWADPTNGVLDKYAAWPFTGPRYVIPRSSKNIPGTTSCLKELLKRFSISTVFSPRFGMLLKRKSSIAILKV